MRSSLNEAKQPYAACYNCLAVKETSRDVWLTELPSGYTDIPKGSFKNCPRIIEFI